MFRFFCLFWLVGHRLGRMGRKLERLRSPAGSGHHIRFSCLMCHAPDAEHGIHFLTFPQNSPEVEARIKTCLASILLESTGTPPSPAALATFTLTRARRTTALSYIYKLDWPRMSRATTQYAIRLIGRLIISSCRLWTGAATTRNPIFEVDLPPRRAL